MGEIQSLLLAAMLFSIFVFLSSSKEGVFDRSSEVVKNNPPNIIFIIADDLGWDVFGNYPGITEIKAKTPTLDSLAHKGITFLNFWVNPVCAPTRASLLTGKYAFRTGVGAVQSPQTAILKSNETIIQKYITDKTTNGYATAVIGKWHVSGKSDLSAPENFGVQYYSGMLGGGVGGEEGGGSYYNWEETSKGVQQTITSYTTTHLVNRSVSWIQKQTKPFFLWLAFNAPHAPFHRPPLNLISDQSLPDKPDSIKKNPLPYFLASIEAMDKEISRLISSLTAAQKENTIFVFIGDNGTPRNVTQPPFRNNHSKNSLFQGGINTPLIVCGKNITRRNVVETAMVQGQDMFATFADIAGTGTSVYQDGISFKPLFADANVPKRSFVYSERFGSDSQQNNDGYTIRNSNYKLIHFQDGTEMLYKLTDDPFEKHNLLSNALTTEAQQTLTSCEESNPDYNAYKLKKGHNKRICAIPAAVGMPAKTNTLRLRVFSPTV